MIKNNEILKWRKPFQPFISGKKLTGINKFLVIVYCLLEGRGERANYRCCKYTLHESSLLGGQRKGYAINFSSAKWGWIKRKINTPCLLWERGIIQDIYKRVVCDTEAYNQDRF